MSIEQDFRDYLVAANTPAGKWIWFTTAPQDAPNQFITINKIQDDAQQTTNPGPGHLTRASLEVICSVKGFDQYKQYTDATAIAESVKTAVNSIGAPDTNNRPTYPATVGNSLIYFCSIDTSPDRDTTQGESSLPYQYQEGKGSGIQRIKVPVIFHYWNPNS